MSSLRKMMASSLFIAVFAGMMFAQGGATGAIGGVVQDATGAVIANAKVSIKNEATGEVLRQVTSDASGLFTATLLPVGTYTVEVDATGFPATKFPGVVVRITETTRMTAVVKVNTVKEVVEVQSQVEQVNTTDATTGQSLGAQTITDLPLATRNFQQLFVLASERGELLVRLRRQAGDADAAVTFVADVQANEQRGDLLEDAGILQFTAVDSPDAGNLGRERARELNRIDVVATDDDVAVEGLVAV